MSVGRAACQCFYYAVAYIYLIVQIAALQLIQLPVEFGPYILVAYLLKQRRADERTVEAAYHVEFYKGGVFGIELEIHSRFNAVGQSTAHQFVECAYRVVQNSTLAYSVHSA